MSRENDVRQASLAFYAALNRMANGDAGPMAEVWSTSASATAQHPIGGRDLGSATVLSSFAKVASIVGGGHIELADQMIDLSEDMAVETGVEKGSLTIGGHPAVIDHRVTNIYRLEQGAWKLRHHHTDLSPALLDALARLKKAE